MKKPHHARALAAFDTITEASYRGFAMREFLASNEEVLLATEKLAGSLIAAGLASRPEAQCKADEQEEGTRAELIAQRGERR